MYSEAEFWTRWDEHYKRSGVDGWCRDGIADEQRFMAARRRVLFVLKEPNGWRDTDLRDQLRKGPEHQIWWNVGRWAAGLLDDFPPYEQICGRNATREAMQSIAAINIKKATGGNKSEPEVINAFAHHDRELLREQISYIRPDLVLACGTFTPLVWLLDLRCEGGPPHADVAYDPDRQMQVIRWRHPARCPGRKSYAELAERIRAASAGG